MTPYDMDQIRGDAPATTHLTRFERARDLRVRRVLRVACPDCGATPYSLCEVSK